MNPEAIARQFLLSWDMLDEIMGRCSDAVWRRECPPPISIGRAVFHTLQSAQRYCRTHSRQRVEMDPFNFGGNELKVAMQDFPNIEEVREYSVAVRKRAIEWLKRLSKNDLNSESKSFRWTGNTAGERILYTLKHFNHHLGQINLILRQQGIETVEWKCVR
jgi:uncharacterized damage-inducible protein DinB